MENSQQLYLLVKDTQINQKQKVQKMVSSQQQVLVNLTQYQMETKRIVSLFTDINQKILRSYQRITKLQRQVDVRMFRYQEKKLENYQLKRQCGKVKNVHQVKQLGLRHIVPVVRTNLSQQKSMVTTMTKVIIMFI